MNRFRGTDRPPGARRGTPRGHSVAVESPVFRPVAGGVHYRYRGRSGFLIDAGPGSPCVCGAPAAAWYVCASCRALFFGQRGSLVRVDRAPRDFRQQYRGRNWTTPDEHRLSVEDRDADSTELDG